MEVEANASGQTQAKTKFCKHCGGTIPQDAVMCTHCGRQVEELAGAAQPQVVIQGWAYFICLRWAFLGSDGLSTLSFCSQKPTRIMFRAAPLYRVKMF